jgi:hypothetical protein
MITAGDDRMDKLEEIAERVLVTKEAVSRTRVVRYWVTADKVGFWAVLVGGLIHFRSDV